MHDLNNLVDKKVEYLAGSGSYRNFLILVFRLSDKNEGIRLCHTERSYFHLPICTYIHPCALLT